MIKIPIKNFKNRGASNMGGTSIMEGVWKI
jgi:hypothetical protein